MVRNITELPSVDIDAFAIKWSFKMMERTKEINIMHVISIKDDKVT